MNITRHFCQHRFFSLLAEKIGYDESTKELFFEAAPHGDICPLDVVDGQHRIEGLKMAAESNENLLNFQIAVVIADKLTYPEKMLQFLIVNARQKPVDLGMEQSITARFTRMDGLEKLPYLPDWLSRKTEKGSDAKAEDIVLYLNNEPSSPWLNRVHLVDAPKNNERHTINQSTFQTYIKRHILAKNHPLSSFEDAKRCAILKNFWTAIREIFVGDSDDYISNSAAFKSVGVSFFLGISSTVMYNVAKKSLLYGRSVSKLP